MKPELIYAVKQEHGIGPDRKVDIVAAYRDRKKAEEMAEAQNKEYVIPREELFSIIPEEVYLNWPVHPVEDKDVSPDEGVNTWKGYDGEYEGYTLTQYISQFVRCTIFAEDYSLCEIEEVDLI